MQRGNSLGMPSSVGVSWLEVVRFTVIKVYRHHWKCCVETTIIKALLWEHHRREVCQRLDGVSASLCNGSKNMVFKNVVRCRRKAEKVTTEYRSSHYKAKQPASHNLKDDQENSPSGIIKENPVITFGLQSINENG